MVGCPRCRLHRNSDSCNNRMRRRFPGSDFHNTAPTRGDNLEYCEPDYPVSEVHVAIQNSDLPSNLLDAAARIGAIPACQTLHLVRFVRHLDLCRLPLHPLPSRTDTGEPGTVTDSKHIGHSTRVIEFAVDEGVSATICSEKCWTARQFVSR